MNFLAPLTILRPRPSSPLHCSGRYYIELENNVMFYFKLCFSTRLFKKKLNILYPWYQSCIERFLIFSNKQRGRQSDKILSKEDLNRVREMVFKWIDRVFVETETRVKLILFEITRSGFVYADIWRAFGFQRVGKGIPIIMFDFHSVSL